MKDVMQSKVNLYDNTQSFKYKQNNYNNNNNNNNGNVNMNMNMKMGVNSQRSNKSYKTDGDAQVDFSLTMN